MAEQLLSYALTTRQRVKDRLGITSIGFDTLLDRLINAATDYIEKECSRRFKETTYTNELHSVYGAKQNYIFLNHAPISSIISFQYRSGTPSTPNWTDFLQDEYELVRDGSSGIIRVYGILPRGDNTIRASYVSGYKINFANAGDNLTHTLPADITDLAERLVIRLFKRREAAGKVSEAFEAGNVTWKDLLDSEDTATIARYRRPPAFV